MKNFRTSTLRLLLLLALLMLAASAYTSCSDHKEDIDPALPHLEAIEAIIETEPDSASRALTAISPDSLCSPASRALYYLLSTSDHNRNQDINKEDWKIAQSINFYKSTNDSSRLALSYFHNSWRLMLSDSLAEAMVNIEEGLSINSDSYFNIRFNSLAADIYLSLNNIQKELCYRERAFRVCETSKNTKLYDFCLTLYTTSLVNNNLYSEALDVINSHELRTSPVISAYLSEIKSNKGMCLYYLGRKEEAKKVLLDAVRINPEYVSSLGYRILSSYYINSQPDSALIWLTVIPKYHSRDIAYYHGMVDYYHKLGEGKNALIMTDSVSLLQNIKVSKTLQQEFNSKLSAFQAEKERLAKESYKRKLYIWIFIVAFTVTPALFVFIMYRKRTKSQTNEYKEKNSLLSTLVSTKELDNNKLKLTLEEKEHDLKIAQSFINESEKRYNDVSQELKLFLKNRNTIFNKLCSEYFSHEDGSTHGKTAIYNKLKNEIDSFSSSKSINEIKDIVNHTHNNILVKLTEVFNLKEIDIIFIALTIAGFSAPIICYVTDISSANYYKKRSRFQAKFRDYNGIYSEEFEEIFK
ncbi:hypothetical protein ED551_02900 [Muribaculaceae bacterium Isolate-013 (NCI)]|nr:hypothetical protein ED551_02900 [Muribaculaceae bacterium Isolate-013 (NCI)]